MLHRLRRTALVGISLVAALSWGSLSQALPFRNGSFEEATVYPPPDGTHRFGSFLSGPSPIVGWFFNGGGDVEYVGADFWQHAEGQHSLELNGAAAGSIAQVFDTIEGATYRVNFSMSGHPGEDGIGARATVGRPLDKHVQVVADSAPHDFTFHTAGITFEDMGWVEYEFDFVAHPTNGTSQLTFVSFNQVPDPHSSDPACRISGGCYGPVIDNVRVVLVPEPRVPLQAFVALGLAAASELRTRAGSARCGRARTRGPASRA